VAFRGIVDTDAYVVDGYQSPIDYFSPAESVSDYILPQNYFTFSEPYVFSSLEVNVAFTLQADAIYRRTIEEYTWDDFAESNIIDRTWDEWFGDRWDSGGTAFSFGIILDAAGGKLQKATATLEAFNSKLTDGAYIASGAADITASASVDADGSRLRGDTFEITAQATQQTTGARIANGQLSPTMVASVSPTGNAFFRSPTLSITASYSTDVVGNATFGAAKTVSTVFSVAPIGNATYRTSLELFALYSKLADGFVITLADPFNVFKVIQETRTLLTPEENKTIKVFEETRLNTLQSETNTIKVSQETRQTKIARPGFTNRSSIPRVRSET